jgi:hypothetical protein
MTIFQILVIYVLIQWVSMNLMGFAIQRNAFAKKEIAEIRNYSILALVVLLFLLGFEAFDFFESLLFMLFAVGIGGVLILFVLFYSLMVLGIIFWKTLELKRNQNNQALFILALLFLPVGMFFLKESE